MKFDVHIKEDPKKILNPKIGVWYDGLKYIPHENSCLSKNKCYHMFLCVVQCLQQNDVSLIEGRHQKLMILYYNDLANTWQDIYGKTTKHSGYLEESESVIYWTPIKQWPGAYIKSKRKIK